jgi:hypothetical protein
MPGLLEAHGHPLMEAIVLSDRMVDIRPVTLRDADAVVDAIRREVATRDGDGAYLNGFDPLLQPGVPEPTLAWLDGEAPDTPPVIVHNSGHKAYFNTAAARRAGLTRDTPDPKGAKYGRDANGDLDGTAEVTGAVFSLLSDGSIPATTRRCCTPNSRGSIAPDSPRVRKWLSTRCSGLCRADARRPHRSTARLRDLQCRHDHRHETGSTATTCTGRSASRSGSTAHRGSATSTCPSPISIPTPPGPSA